MSNPAFFTVAVPTFNRAEFLKESVTAILNQSFEDFELLIADNHSEDNTAKVVASFDDPRIRYCCHDENRGALGNFLFISTEAKGEFLVINQDDDLIHRDFLKRCHEAVAGDSAVTMYASALWRGNLETGFTSRLMGDTGSVTDYLLKDDVVIVDGYRAATTFLYTKYFLHPAIAFRTAALKEVGGYCADQDQSNDIITEARILCEGNLAYDPRPGAVFRFHADNAYRGTISSQVRRAMGHNCFHRLVEIFDLHNKNWLAMLKADLQRFGRDELLGFINEWIRYDAPLVLQRTGFEALQNATGKNRAATLRFLGKRIGYGKSLRYLLRDFKGG